MLGSLLVLVAIILVVNSNSKLSQLPSSSLTVHVPLRLHKAETGMPKHHSCLIRLLPRKGRLRKGSQFVKSGSGEGVGLSGTLPHWPIYDLLFHTPEVGCSKELLSPPHLVQHIYPFQGMFLGLSRLIEPIV